MSPLVAKEFRLLQPAFVMALLLAVIPLWLLPTQEDGAKFIIYVALGFGTLMMALSSFGREFGMNTFPLLLAQPLTRARIWRTKIAVLTGAIATVWIFFLVSWVVSYSLKAWTFDWFRRNVGADLLAADLLILTPFVILVSGLWATLLLRQMVAAFWFALLIPVVILVVLDWKGATTLTVSITFGVYSIIGFWWAWRLFSRVQEAAWTGGEVTLPAWGLSRTASEATTRPFRPIRALFWKELKLQQIALVGMGGLFLLHLGVVLVRKATHGAIENTVIETALEMFGGIWFIVPVVTGSLNVADERRLGTMEGHLCLPVSSRVQFVIKLLVAVVASGLLSAVLLVIAETIGIKIVGTGTFLVGGGVSTAAAKGDLSDFSLGVTLLLGPIFVSISLVSFYASTLSRNIMQSVATAVVTGSVLALAAVVAENVHRIGDITLWQGPLLAIVGWPTMAVTLVWLAYGNFRRLSETRRLWLRNICGLGFTMLGIATVTAGLYNRTWELLTPLEPQHGPVRLSLNPPTVVRTDGSGTLLFLLPDGRLWRDRAIYDPQRRLDIFRDCPALMPGGQWIDLISGNHFIEGSNWVDAASSLPGIIVAIRSDGTLWISEISVIPSYPISQRAVKMVKIGNDTNWKSVLHGTGLATMVLLKTDGTLWRWGTKDFRGMLTDIKPHRLGDESDWSEIVSTDFGLFAWKKDGRAWRFNYFQTKDTQNPQMSLDPEVDMERWVNFDKVKWRSQGGFMFFGLGVREDGTLWTFVAEPVDGAYALGDSVPKGSMQIGNATNWVSVAGCNRMLVALKADGSLWKWEWDSWGLGQTWPTVQPPTRLGIHNDWVAIGTGLNGVVSLAADGSLWHWTDRANYYVPLMAPTRKPTEIENIFEQKK